MTLSPLAWLDAPTEPGWYWFRVNPSTVIRGPALVIKITGPATLLMSGQSYPAGLYVHDGWAAMKPASHFQRSWAGPLPRPVGDTPLVLEDDATIRRRRRKR